MPLWSGQHLCWRTPECNIKPRIYNKLCVLTTGVMACVIYGLNGAASIFAGARLSSTSNQEFTTNYVF
jgi:hypothetical protein